MKFNIVLTSLSEDTLGRIKAIVEMPDQLQAPYECLKERLIEIYQPDVWECAARLLHMRELGDLKPSQLMDDMLALLPVSETPGVLFKSVFLARLPGDMRDHVQAHAERLSCRELAGMADNIWQSRNARRCDVAAALPMSSHFSPTDEEVDSLTETVAAINMKKRVQQQQQRPRPPARKGGSQSQLVCWKHLRFGKKARDCADPDNCSFRAEN